MVLVFGFIIHLLPTLILSFMTKTITQKIIFNNATPSILYNFYMNAKLHSKLTGAPAKINAKACSSFTAHGNYIKGKNLHLVKDKMIVQTWRGSDWAKADQDSVFMLSFELKGKDVEMNMTHANIPDRQVADIKDGWNVYYWKPWKEYLKSMDKKI
jgi:activator of HSP90 ATPase